MWKAIFGFIVVLALLFVVKYAENKVPFAGLAILAFFIGAFLIIRKITSVKRDRLDRKELEAFREKLSQFDASLIEPHRVEIFESAEHVYPKESGFSTITLFGKVLDRKRPVDSKIVKQCQLKVKANSESLISPTLPIEKEELQFRISVRDELKLYRSQADKVYYIDLTFIDSLKSYHFGIIPLTEIELSEADR